MVRRAKSSGGPPLRLRLGPRLLDEITGRPDRYPYYDSEFREAAVPQFPYSVIYRPLPTGDVQVIAVAHASRAPGYWRDRA